MIANIIFYSNLILDKNTSCHKIYSNINNVLKESKITKQNSDEKLFKYFWWYHHSSGDYIFEEREMIEVEVVIVKGYGWNGKLWK